MEAARVSGRLLTRGPGAIYFLNTWVTATGSAAVIRSSDPAQV